MVINLIVGTGDGYKYEDQLPWINYLEKHGFKCIQIPLLEINPSVSYEDLKSNNYCKYIDSFINPNLSSSISNIKFMFSQSFLCVLARSIAPSIFA